MPPSSPVHGWWGSQFRRRPPVHEAGSTGLHVTSSRHQPDLTMFAFYLFLETASTTIAQSCAGKLGLGTFTKTTAGFFTSTAYELVTNF